MDEHISCPICYGGPHIDAEKDCGLCGGDSHLMFWYDDDDCRKSLSNYAARLARVAQDLPYKDLPSKDKNLPDKLERLAKEFPECEERPNTLWALKRLRTMKLKLDHILEWSTL